MTSSSPGGQWLPFRGHEVVPSLSHPLYTPSFHHIPRWWVQNPRHPKKFHIKIITRQLFQTNSVSSSRPVSFNWKLYLIYFLCYPTFISKLFHFITYPTGIGSWTLLLYWISFHYLFLNRILSSVHYDLWKTIELLSTSFFQIPSVIAWRRYLEKGTVQGSEKAEWQEVFSIGTYSHPKMVPGKRWGTKKV